MIVTPIASTNLHFFPDSVDGTNFGDRTYDDMNDGRVRGTDMLAEFAGRACYQAWGLKNPATAKNDGYLNNIISQGHFSVLEHSSVTFYVEGVSRSLTHELIRHRHLSFSELSQRYVDIEGADIVAPPALADDKDGALRPFEHLDVFASIRSTYARLVQNLVDDGYPRKKAREAARAVMPNATETKLVLTGNLRAYRDMLGKRWHVAADAEIREFAGEILSHLREIAPNSVQDIPDEPYE